MTKPTIEQRLKSLEDKVFAEDKPSDKYNEEILIDIPGAWFLAGKYQMRKARREEKIWRNEIWRNIRYDDSVGYLDALGGRLMTVSELQTIKQYMVKKRPKDWNTAKAVEEELGLKEFEFDEFIFDCDELAGIRWDNGANAGVFALLLNYAPSDSSNNIGFRCCRDIKENPK